MSVYGSSHSIKYTSFLIEFFGVQVSSVQLHKIKVMTLVFHSSDSEFPSPLTYSKPSLPGLIFFLAKTAT